jgi:type II secretory pathway pseudopilin PulG
MRRHQRRPHPLALARARRARRGLTLVELLLSATLGIVMLGAAVAVLLAAGRMRRNQQLLSDANEEARTALRQVSRSLSATGAGGAVYAYLDPVTNERKLRPALSFSNGITALHDPGMPQTPDTLTLLRYGADRRTVLVNPITTNQVTVAPDGRQATTPGVVPDIFLQGESALVTNFQRSMLVPFERKSLGMDPIAARDTVQLTPLVDAAALQDSLSPIQPGATVFPVRVIRISVEYVAKQDKHPERADLILESLDAQTFQPFNPPQKTVLAKDIEDFQVQWGYDRNGDGVMEGGFTDQGPTDTALDPGLAFARITLSARTSTSLVTEQGEYLAKEETPFERGIDLGGPRPPQSGHRRRVLSTVVLLKNLAAPNI